MERVMDFSSSIKRGVKNFIPELKNRDDYVVEMIDVNCINCGGPDKSWKYKFDDEKQWRIYEKPMHCRDCEIKDYLSKGWDDHSKQVKENLVDRYWSVPENLKNAGFKTYKRTNKVTSKAVDSCIDYAKNFLSSPAEKRYNLLVMGSPGSGKSHLTVTIARTLRAEGYIVGFLTTGQLLSMIKETYKKGAERTEQDIFKDIEKFDLLVLDDLGAEMNTKDEFSWAKTKLFEIVNRRLGKPTIYTTNFDDFGLPEAVGDRVASRLYANTKFIDMFTEEDYRKTQKII